MLCSHEVKGTTFITSIYSSYFLHSDTFSQNSAKQILYVLEQQLLEEFVDVTNEI